MKIVVRGDPCQVWGVYHDKPFTIDGRYIAELATKRDESVAFRVGLYAQGGRYVSDSCKRVQHQVL